MQKIQFAANKSPMTVLCLGAHCDDIEIGCGATLVQLTKQRPDLVLRAVVLSSTKERESETRNCLADLLDRPADSLFTSADFRDGYLPYEAASVKDFLRDWGKQLRPDVVFTHSREDLHQDHRFVGDLSHQVFRDSLILEMEIPKYDGDLGRPNFYSVISETAARKKVAVLLKHYVSQRDKPWFAEETFLSLMRIRGIECRSATGFAEAFYSSKLILE